MATVTVRYWAAARTAAGRSTETTETIGAGTLAEIIGRLSADRPELARVLGICSFLVDDRRADPATTTLPDGAVVDALPPFAGG